MCIKIIFRILLVAVNIAIGLIGFSLVGGGTAVLVADKIAGDELGDLLVKVADIAKSIGLSDVDDSEVDKDQLVADVMSFADNGAITLIICGAVIFGLGILGCCSGCCESKCALIIYAVIAFAVGLVLVLLTALFFQGEFNDDIKASFQKMIDDKFVGIDSYLPESMLLNFIQIKFECCGIDDYMDYTTSSSWDNVRTYDENGVDVDKILVTPVACCYMDGEFPDVEPIDDECATHPTDITSNWRKSCWEAVSEDLKTYETPILVVVILLIIFIFVLAFAAFYIFIDEMCCSVKVSPI